ncbi:type II toxin-antitoxin system HipA family toxin [Anaerovibrio sp. JC8]|uniref:type II toxin-antitoxin system HipA family toxin n=1 Tax=Anaerovibrio sp. JC8 TaxID=1240085 RepID=UPI001177A8A4|nr:type II toxin-antitoxin system HipA family toxin [Anaerovibrio sp. JC8]
MSRTIWVYENWSSTNPIILGRLYVDGDKRTEKFSFEYDDKWLLNNGAGITLDPELYLYRGRQYTPLGKQLFGLFSDSCPDRWGRLLLQRREAINARKENRRPNKLTESDYLLGVYDEARMGALRFSVDGGEHFEASDKSLATPPWVTLRTLEAAAFSFENDEDGFEEKWLNQLLAPGSSLGGARPKATVQDTDGVLWIAKFPSKHDTFNSGAWEMVVHDLAKMCGLNVPEARLETFSANGATFIVKRFDREGKRRIHFSSAMSLLGKVDGENDSSYLDIAAFIRANGCKPKLDLIELWRRIVFSMAVNNTDDHLRNHGFVYTPQGWRLSPLYDVNPVPYGDNLSLMVDDKESTVDVDLALETAQYYDIDLHEAKSIAADMFRIVKDNWRELAKNNGLSRNAIEKMYAAFSMVEK